MSEEIIDFFNLKNAVQFINPDLQHYRSCQIMTVIVPLGTVILLFLSACPIL